MGIYGYLFGNFDGISKQTLGNEYVKKSEISFNTMSANEQHNYIKKDKYLDEIDQLKNIEPKVVEKIVEVEKIVYKDKIVEVEKIVEKIVPVEKIVEKIVYKDKIIEAEPKIIEKIVYKDKEVSAEPKIVEKIIYKDKVIQGKEKIIEKVIVQDRIIDKSKFNTFRCYGMSPSGFRLTTSCAANLKKFLEKNSDSKYFEVIGVMNPKDFRSIVILKQKLELLKELDLSAEQVDTLKDLVAVGLDKLRVNETIWEVKKILGRQAAVVPVSYDVHSKNVRGTVLRAYK